MRGKEKLSKPDTDEWYNALMMSHDDANDCSKIMTNTIIMIMNCFHELSVRWTLQCISPAPKDRLNYHMRMRGQCLMAWLQNTGGKPDEWAREDWFFSAVTYMAGDAWSGLITYAAHIEAGEKVQRVLRPAIKLGWK